MRAANMCPALGFVRVRIRLRRFGRSLPSSFDHAYRYENGFSEVREAGGQDLQIDRHFRRRARFFLVRPAPTRSARSPRAPITPPLAQFSP
eukprot:1583277-Prymnesium_polylepis.1